eukprot:PhM_4_TR13962/c1_g1_i1/m.91720
MDPLGEEIPLQAKTMESLSSWNPTPTHGRRALAGRRAAGGSGIDPLGSGGGDLGSLMSNDDRSLMSNENNNSRSRSGGGDVSTPSFLADVVAPPAPAPKKAMSTESARQALTQLSDDEDDFDLPDDSAPAARPITATSVTSKSSSGGDNRNKSGEADLPWNTARKQTSSPQPSPSQLGSKMDETMRPSTAAAPVMATTSTPSAVTSPTSAPLANPTAGGRAKQLEEERRRQQEANATAQKEKAEAATLEAETARREAAREREQREALQAELDRMREQMSVEKSRREQAGRSSTDELARMERLLEEQRSTLDRQAQSNRDLQSQLDRKLDAISSLEAHMQTTNTTLQQLQQQNLKLQQQQQQSTERDPSLHMQLQAETLDSKLETVVATLSRKFAEAQETHAENLAAKLRSELVHTEERLMAHRDERLHLEQQERLRLLQEERDEKVRLEKEDRAERLRRDEEERIQRREREELEAHRRADFDRDERVQRMKKEMEEREAWVESERRRSEEAMTQALERLAAQHKVSEEHYIRMSSQQAKEMESRFVSEKTLLQQAHRTQLDALSQKFQQMMQIQENQHKKSLEAMSLHAENATAIRETWNVLQKNVEAMSHLRMVFERQEMIVQQEREHFQRERETVIKELTQNLAQQHVAVEREKHQFSNLLTEIQSVYTTQHEHLVNERGKLTMLMKKGEAQRQVWEKEHRSWMNERGQIETERNELLAQLKHALGNFAEEGRKLRSQREEIEEMKERISYEAAARQEQYERQQVDLDERLHKARAMMESQWGRIKAAEADLAIREDEFQGRTAQLHAAAAEVKRRAEAAEGEMKSAEQKLEASERTREQSVQQHLQGLVSATRKQQQHQQHQQTPGYDGSAGASTTGSSSTEDEKSRLRRERRQLEQERQRLLELQQHRLAQQQAQLASMHQNNNQNTQQQQQQQQQYAARQQALEDESRRITEIDRRMDQLMTLYPAFNAPKTRYDPSMSHLSTSMVPLNPIPGNTTHNQTSASSLSGDGGHSVVIPTNMTTLMNDTAMTQLFPSMHLTHLRPIPSTDADTSSSSSMRGFAGYTPMVVPTSALRGGGGGAYNYNYTSAASPAELSSMLMSLGITPQQAQQSFQHNQSSSIVSAVTHRDAVTMMERAASGQRDSVGRATTTTTTSTNTNPTSSDPNSGRGTIPTPSVPESTSDEGVRM